LARYTGILVLAVAALFAVDELGSMRFWVSGGLVVLALPASALLHVGLRRTGHLSPVGAITDQLAASVVLVLVPELYAGLLLVMLGLSTFAAVAHGRRLAAACSVVGIATVAVLALVDPATYPWPWAFTYGVAVLLIVRV